MGLILLLLITEAVLLKQLEFFVIDTDRTYLT